MENSESVCAFCYGFWGKIRASFGMDSIIYTERTMHAYKTSISVETGEPIELNDD
jgi:hypothetical protein